MPSSIARCRALHRLDVDANQLIELPRRLGHLPKLAELSARRNALAVLHAAPGRFSRLEVLYLAHNALRTLPAGLASTPLRRLDLSGNPLGRVPSVLIEPSAHAFAQLRSLSLRDSNLAGVQEGLGARASIVELDLAANPALVSLPDDVFRLPMLRRLDVSRTGFTTLPESLLQMNAAATIELEGLVFATHGRLQRLWIEAMRRVGARSGPRLRPSPFDGFARRPPNDGRDPMEPDMG